MSRARRPDSAPGGATPQALYARGIEALRAGDAAAAAQAFAHGLAQAPGEPALGLNLALARLRLDAPADALAALDAVAQRGGELAAWHDCRGHALRRLGRAAEAVAAFNASFARGPASAASQDALAKALEATGALNAAIDTQRELLASFAGADEASARNRAIVGNNLANVLVKAGRIDDGLAAYAEAMAAWPAFPGVAANYLLALHYHPDVTAQALYTAHRDFAARHCDPLSAQAAAPLPAAAPRPLVVGLLAGKLHRSPQLMLYLRGFEQLDPAAVRLVVYDFGSHHDDYSRRLAACAAAWRAIDALDDADAAAQMRADGLDILIFKAGHAETRPRIPARRPAPVQVAWGGFNTTGMTAADWFLGDPVENPPGCEAYYTESIARLPDSYTVFTPPPETPAVAPLPARETGAVTFGCFNKTAKLNDRVARAWAELLAAVPNSRLYLRGEGFDDPATASELHGRLRAAGLPEARLVTAGPTNHIDLLASYAQVDIALDPWPYSGGVTTLEALWMGVPVVTLPGPSFAGRHSASHLALAGLRDWIAADWADYRAIPARWAQAPEALAELRAGLRARLANGPSCDGARFARHLTAALQDMHRRAAEAP